MPSKKLNSKQVALQKRKRRQMLSFMRMCRYGINNFTRNAWLTVAATAIMTITLLIVFTTLAARNTLVTTVDSIRDKVDMSIYLKNDTTDEAVKQITSDLGKLESVKKVTYISPSKARESFAKENGRDPNALSALNEAINKFPGTLRVNLVDIDDTAELVKFIKTNPKVKESIDPDRESSLAGDRRNAIENIGRWVSFADKVGLAASIVFIAISSLIVFNTIRMAIFNRKDEIEMMKLIGADKSFIRGPFIVEAVVYGFIAAVLATAIGFTLLYSAKDKLLQYEVAVAPTIDFLTLYIGFLLLALIALGAVIGVGSSLLATRRYLKI